MIADHELKDKEHWFASPQAPRGLQPELVDELLSEQRPDELAAPGDQDVAVVGHAFANPAYVLRPRSFASLGHQLVELELVPLGAPVELERPAALEALGSAGSVTTSFPTLLLLSS